MLNNQITADIQTTATASNKYAYMKPHGNKQQMNNRNNNNKNNNRQQQPFHKRSSSSSTTHSSTTNTDNNSNKSLLTPPSSPEAIPLTTTSTPMTHHQYTNNNNSNNLSNHAKKKVSSTYEYNNRILAAKRNGNIRVVMNEFISMKKNSVQMTHHTYNLVLESHAILRREGTPLTTMLKSKYYVIKTNNKLLTHLYYYISIQ